MGGFEGDRKFEEDEAASPRAPGESDEYLLPYETDPAAPLPGEQDETEEFEAAVARANEGDPEAAAADAGEFAGAESAAGLLPIDWSRVREFLNACVSSSPRVGYGLGKKIPSDSSVPGRDFTKVDCSGFVRSAIRRSTSPKVAFPDGSVVQHDWVRAQGFERVAIADGKLQDGRIRIAFLRPQDSPKKIGHVVLIRNGRTVESHSGVGPNSRAFDGSGWQAKSRVYVLA